MRSTTKITTKTCPVCQNPDATCEHGLKDELGTTVHIWDCPECGEDCVLVFYDCPECQEIFEANA